MPAGRRRDAAFVVASLVMAALFVRLGIRQLHRLDERRARNALVASRRDGAPVPLAAVPRDSARAHYLRVSFAGTYDFAHQIVLVNRVRDGAPGVQLVTPLHPDSGLGDDTAVLVDRGWVYSPDGASIEGDRWSEPEHVVGTGYVLEFSPGRGRAVTLSDHPDRFRWLDPTAAAERVGRPLLGSYVVLEGERGPGAVKTPVRVPPPALDDGPHLSYAIQWFAFAAIALVGPFVAIYVIPRRKG